MDDFYELVRKRLGFECGRAAKVFVYAHGYGANNIFLAEIGVHSGGGYQWYTGDFDAFGQVLRDRLNNLHKEIINGTTKVETWATFVATEVD